MAQKNKKFESLAGKFLIAMPDMSDPRFAKSVVYLVEHDTKGAMGVVVNKKIGQISLKTVLAENNLVEPLDVDLIDIYFGGPVEHDRGTLLHSSDITFEHSITLPDTNLAVTATIDALYAVAHNEGPAEKLFVLGYAVWTAGQLEQEMKDNSWLVAPVSPTLIFSEENGAKWEKALMSIGLTPNTLSSYFGHA